jgi:flagellin
MSLSILNNIPSLAAQNQLALTGSNLQRTLFRLSSGSRINSGADDAAGLAIADGLRANITALTQSARNANDGVGMAQVADGALAQVTSMLNRAVTLATEASTGTVGTSQRTDTTFNGTKVFGGAAGTDIYLTDSTTGSSITLAATTLTAAGLGLTGNLKGATGTAAQTELTAINTAIQTVASDRGTLGASINRLQSASNVINNEVQNLTTAEDGIRAADIPAEVANLTKYSILNQTGISAMAQANQMQQSVLALLK